MSLPVQFGLLIFATVVGFFGIVVGLPVWLHHRRTMLKLKGQNGRDIGTLHKRIDDLEKQCHKLQEQVTEAHVLLADERRELDRRLENKLAQIAPDAAIIPGADAPDDPSARQRRGRMRE